MTSRGTKFGDGWLNLILSRIGYDSTVDYAARALIEMQDHAFHRGESFWASFMSNHGEALTGLRISIGKEGTIDEALLAAALLVLFERDPKGLAKV